MFTAVSLPVATVRSYTCAHKLIAALGLPHRQLHDPSNYVTFPPRVPAVSLERQILLTSVNLRLVSVEKCVTTPR